MIPERWGIALIAGAALVTFSACGGDGGGSTQTPAEDTSTPSPTAEATVRATNVVEEDGEDLDRSDISFVDNLLVKVEDGEWTLGEGLVATLRLFAGELEEATVLRHPDLINREDTGILSMAEEYVTEGPDEGAKAEITRLLGLLVFSNEQLEAMAGIGQPTAALAGEVSPGAARLAEEDCKAFFHGFVIPGVSKCLEVKTATIGGKLYRVFHPAPSLPTAGWTDDRYELALTAMKEAVPVYNGLDPPLAMSPVNLVFSVADGGSRNASAVPKFGETCGVAVFTKMQSKPDADFKQVLAHELAHCYQQQMFPTQRVGEESIKWREEGLAEHLSNVAYPGNNLEWRDWLARLASLELSTTIFDRSYENFLFFQYLDNRLGIRGVFTLVRSLPTSGSPDDQVTKLAEIEGIDVLYHDFAKALTDKTVIDASGATVPFEAESKRVEINSEATPILREPIIEPFAVTRHRLLVKDKNQAALNFKWEGVLESSSRPTDEEGWLAVPWTLPDADCKPEVFVVVTTTKPDGAFELDVPAVLDVNPQGLQAEWTVNNSSVREQINAWFPEDKVDSNTGTVRATFRDDGTVKVVYENAVIKGHSNRDVSHLGLFKNYNSEQKFTTNADGVDTYVIHEDNIIFGSLFEEQFLNNGTETVKLVETADIPFGRGVDGEELFIPHDLDEEWQNDPPGGWVIFGGIQDYEVRCQDSILLLGDTTLHRVGNP